MVGRLPNILADLGPGATPNRPARTGKGLHLAADEHDAIHLSGPVAGQGADFQVPPRTPAKVVMAMTLRRVVAEARRFTFLMRWPFQ